MGKFREFADYTSVGVGLAFATCSFTMMSGLFRTGNIWLVLLATVSAGLVCTAISFSVAELASMFPSSPGIRTYLKRGVGERTSLAMSYLYVLFLVLVAGVEAYLFALVCHSVYPAMPPLLLVLAVLALVAAVNLAGLELPQGVQVLSTAALVLAVLGISAAGLVGAATGSLPAHPEDFARPEGWLALPAMIGMAIFLFVGFEWTTPLGKGPESYRQLIPWSMPTAIGINVVTNGIFMIALALIIGRDATAASPIPHLPYGLAALGPIGGPAALAIAALASFSTFNAGILGGSRFLYALAREGTMPKAFATLSPRRGHPYVAVAALSSATIASSLIILKTRTELVASVIGAAIVCVVYGALMVSNLRLRKLRPAQARPFRSSVPAWIQVGLAALLPALGILSLVEEESLGMLPVAAFGVSLAGCALAATKVASRAGAAPPRAAFPERSLGTGVQVQERIGESA